MKLKDSFHPYAVVTIVFWSLAYVFTRLALQYFSALSLGFLRYLIASVTLAVVAVLFKIKPPAKRDWGWFLLSGAVGFFLYMILFNVGSQSVTASTGSVVIATVPILTALAARIFYSERLKSIQWIAIGVEFSGILLLTLMNGAFTMNRGILWLLVAACALSAYNLLQRRLTKSYSALQASTYSIFAGTAMLAVFLPESMAELRGAPGVQLFYIVVLGVFCSAIAYVSWSKAFAKAPRTSSVSNYMFVTPFLTTLLGFLLANELPDTSTLLGGAVILCGAFLFHFRGNAA